MFVLGFDENWGGVDVELILSGLLLLVISDECFLVVFVVFNNGIWSNIGDGYWIGKGCDEVFNVILSEEIIKYVVYFCGLLCKVLVLLM